jgi:N-acetylglucosamine kinase-like BadF-type ATPase
VSASELEAHYSTALDGFPRAVSVAVCAAGAGSPAGRERLRRLLAPRLRGASLTVLPDYAAAWAVAPVGTEIVVIAGTGSVVASRRSDGGYAVTGGAGVAGGDPGSAVRLGRAALAHAGANASRLSAVAVARHAARLTAAAGRGERGAADLLRAELAPLADEVRRHAMRIGAGLRPLVAATGGVLRNRAALAALAADLGPAFVVARIDAEPVVGAVRIARELAA